MVEETREGGGDAGGRDGEASEGVVPGSTNQRQDAIDRHVAPGWCNEFRRGWKGGSSSASAATVTATAEVVVAMAKETEMVRQIERGKAAAAPVEDERAAGGRGAGGGRRERGGDARVLHTPLHLLVNRINQRHHGLSPIPLRFRASTFLNLLSHFLPPPPVSSFSAWLHLSLSLLPHFLPRLILLYTTTSVDSIAIYSQHAPT